MIDYHVHTSLCNHASGTMEDYVCAAIGKGLAAVCFLDHLTLQAGGRHNAMDPREVPRYVDEARRLAQRYAQQIDVRVGLEIDFSPRHVDRCIEIVNSVDLDVVGGSVHFIEGEDVVSRRSAWGRGERDADEIYHRYLDVLESMLDYDYLDVICHFDLPKKFGTRPTPAARQAQMDLLTKIRERNLAVELNTSGFHYPVEEAFPAPELLARCAQLKIPVVTGSDAHSPESVGRDFDRAREMLHAAGYRHLTAFRQRQRQTIPL